ncbi:MAG: hypothetical protein R2932_32150 [Caldilineaceae bacterium]
MNERIREKNHLRWQRNRRKREIEAQKPAIANKVATRLFGGKAATIRVSAPRDPDRERREQIARDLDPKRSTPRPRPNSGTSSTIPPTIHSWMLTTMTTMTSRPCFSCKIDPDCAFRLIPVTTPQRPKSAVCRLCVALWCRWDPARIFC